VGPGAVRSADLVVMVAPDTPPSTVDNTSTASSLTTIDPGPSSNSATASVAVTAAADLVVSKTTDVSTVPAGSELTYHLQVENLGPSVAVDVSLTDDLPASVTFVSVTTSTGAICTSPGVGTSGLVVCSWAGPTAPGEFRTADLVVAVVAGTSGFTLDNTAEAVSPTTDPAANNNAATVSVAVSPTPVVAIPTLSGLAALLFGMLLAASGFIALRRP
jgi:uncharacterized repeat protein (TIGR01451 family)